MNINRGGSLSNDLAGCRLYFMNAYGTAKNELFSVFSVTIFV